MSPQPKWRVSAERLVAILERMPPDGTVIEYGVAEAWRAFLDLRDARAEIDTLQAAVRDLRTALIDALGQVCAVTDQCAGEAGITCCSYGGTPHGAVCLSGKVRQIGGAVLARTDKLLPEDE